MNNEVRIGIGDMKILKDEGTLITYALGSCIGITLYDPVIKLGGLIHIMLPNSAGQVVTNPYKFADTGIQHMLKQMALRNGMKNRYICKVAGGAQMFEMSGAIGNIGERNITTVREILSLNNIRISRQDVGSNYARTMMLDVKTGQVKIRTIGKPEIIL